MKSRGNYYLSVSRLVPNKRIDLLVKAFNQLNLPLIIVGNGPEKKKLMKIAKGNISFLNYQDDLAVKQLMENCRAFVYAGTEDFGIAPVEAMAAGAPVIGYGRGGLLDTVNCLTKFQKNEIPTGILFNEQSSNNIVDTINWFEDKNIWRKFNSQNLNAYAQRFNSKNFEKKFENSIQRYWDRFIKKN